MAIKPTKEKVEEVAVARGMFHVFGEDNAGKSTFGLTAHPDPSKICFLDGDSSKTRGFAQQMNIGKYVDLTNLGNGLDELGYHEMVLAQINAVPEGKFEVIVFDNPDEFFKGGHTYVKANRGEFRKNWNPMGAIAGAQEWNELRQTHYPRVYSKLKNKATLVIVCTRVKAQSEAGVKTGLTEPSADESLRTASEVVIRLARNTRDIGQHAPVGLVIKNTMVWQDQRLKKVFPDRIVPCTWDKLKSYLANPVHGRELTEKEQADEFEWNLITGTLNAEQLELLKYRQRVKLLQAEEALVNDILDARIKHKDMPKKLMPKQIQADLAEAYPDLTEDKIVQIIADVNLTE